MRISVLKILTLIIGNNISELTIVVHGHRNFTRRHESFSNANVVILFTKARSAMDDSSTGILGDELASDHGETLLGRQVLKVVE